MGWFNKLINTGVLKIINNQQKATQDTTEEYCSFTKNGELFKREDYLELGCEEEWFVYSQDYIFYQGKPRVSIKPIKTIYRFNNMSDNAPLLFN